MQPHASEKYGRVTIFLHWVTAGLIVFSVSLGLTAVYSEGSEATQLATFLHQSIGTLIFCLALFRAGWRLGHPAPALPEAMPRYQRFAAAATHLALYFMLILMPISGYVGLAARGREISIFGIFTMPQLVPLSRQLSVSAQNLHNYSQYALYALLALHVGAALYHHYVVKDDILKRMSPSLPLINTPR